MKDTYVKPDYDIAARSAIKAEDDPGDIEEFLVGFSADRKNRVMIIEGDAGVGKSSLLSYLAFRNERARQETGSGIFGTSKML